MSIKFAVFAGHIESAVFAGSIKSVVCVCVCSCVHMIVLIKALY